MHPILRDPNKAPLFDIELEAMLSAWERSNDGRRDETRYRIPHSIIENERGCGWLGNASISEPNIREACMRYGPVEGSDFASYAGAGASTYKSGLHVFSCAGGPTNALVAAIVLSNTDPRQEVLVYVTHHTQDDGPWAYVFRAARGRVVARSERLPRRYS